MPLSAGEDTLRKPDIELSVGRLNVAGFDKAIVNGDSYGLIAAVCQLYTSDDEEIGLQASEDRAFVRCH